MEEPNFWDNPEEAQEQMKRLSSMKEDRDTYQKLVSAKEDMETLIERRMTIPLFRKSRK